MQLASHKSLDDKTKTEWLTAVLNSTTDGFVILDLNGSVKMSNQPADSFLATMTGAEPVNGVFDTQQAISIIGYKPVELIKLITNIRRGNVPEESKSIIHMEDNGKIRYLERCEKVLKSENDEVSGVMIIFRDVTEQVEREEWQREFTSMVVHDLKNPVSTIYTGFEWMAPMIDNPDAEIIINNGQRTTQQLLDMIDSLLDISRMEAGKLSADVEALDIISIARFQINSLLNLSFRKNVNLELEADESVEPIWGDRSMVRRILANLIDNAIKFTPSGGKVSVNISHARPEDRLPGGCRVVISDTGVGVSDKDKARIFNRFEMVGGRGKSYRGTGIGLSFCKQAIEEMGGKIWVEDNLQPTGGSQFVFTMPPVPTFSDDVEPAKKSDGNYVVAINEPA